VDEYLKEFKKREAKAREIRRKYADWNFIENSQNQLKQH